MKKINLQEIASHFSGAILFDGLDNYRIVECKTAYDFDSFKPQQFGEFVLHTPLYQEVIVNHNGKEYVDMDALKDTIKRNTFGEYNKLSRIEKEIKDLPLDHLERLMKVIQNEIDN